jgi:hypothetical protein
VLGWNDLHRHMGGEHHTRGDRTAGCSPRGVQVGSEGLSFLSRNVLSLSWERLWGQDHSGGAGQREE